MYLSLESFAILVDDEVKKKKKSEAIARVTAEFIHVRHRAPKDSVPRQHAECQLTNCPISKYDRLPLSQMLS